MDSTFNRHEIPNIHHAIAPTSPYLATKRQLHPPLHTSEHPTPATTRITARNQKKKVKIFPKT